MSQPITKVALAGASGTLGRRILAALLAANYTVTVLTRQTSSSNATFPPEVHIAKVDYTSATSLESALRGQDALISTLSTTSIAAQEPLILAALAARVRRIIPSEFGSDTHQPANAALPVFAPKLAIEKLLVEGVARSQGQSSYTIVQNNVFLDWGIAQGLLLDAKRKAIVLYDGGETPYSATPVGAVADAVVGVLKRAEETADRVVKVHGAVLTQKRLLELGKKALGEEEGWRVEEVGTEEVVRRAWEGLEREPGDVMGWALGFLKGAIFSEAHRPVLPGVENGLLGVGETGEEEILGWIREAAGVGA